jgi:hypothetical protein
MVDAGIKKTRIKREDLPLINTDTEGYILRYRILSEDKNRTSHWSPFYNTDAVSVDGASGALSITQTIIMAVWGDENNHPSYDVFVSFDGDPFYWHGTSTVHSYSFLNEGTTTVHVKVQLASSKKQIKAGLGIFDSGSQSLI